MHIDLPHVGIAEMLEETNVGEIPESTKIVRMVEKAKELLRDDPTNKIVIVSQWTSFLDMIQEQLDDVGIGMQRLDGTMSVGKRRDALQR